MKCPKCNEEALFVNGKYICVECGIEITPEEQARQYNSEDLFSASAPVPHDNSITNPDPLVAQSGFSQAQPQSQNNVANDSSEDTKVTESDFFQGPPLSTSAPLSYEPEEPSIAGGDEARGINPFSEPEGLMSPDPLSVNSVEEPALSSGGNIYDFPENDFQSSVLKEQTEGNEAEEAIGASGNLAGDELKTWPETEVAQGVASLTPSVEESQSDVDLPKEQFGAGVSESANNLGQPEDASQESRIVPDFPEPSRSPDDSLASEGTGSAVSFDQAVNNQPESFDVAIPEPEKSDLGIDSNLSSPLIDEATSSANSQEIKEENLPQSDVFSESANPLENVAQPEAVKIDSVPFFEPQGMQNEAPFESQDNQGFSQAQFQENQPLAETSAFAESPTDAYQGGPEVSALPTPELEAANSQATPAPVGQPFSGPALDPLENSSIDEMINKTSETDSSFSLDTIKSGGELPSVESVFGGAESAKEVSSPQDYGLPAPPPPDENKKKMIIVASMAGVFLIGVLTLLFFFARGGDPYPVAMTRENINQISAVVTEAMDKGQDIVAAYQFEANFQGLTPKNPESVKHQEAFKEPFRANGDWLTDKNGNIHHLAQINNQNTKQTFMAQEKKTFTFNQANNNWTASEGNTITSIPTFLDPKNRSSVFYATNIRTLTRVGTEEVNDISAGVFEIRPERGFLNDLDFLGPVFSEVSFISIDSSDLKIEVWVGNTDRKIHKIKLDGKLTIESSDFSGEISLNSTATFEYRSVLIKSPEAEVSTIPLLAKKENKEYVLVAPKLPLGL